jgi:hypothetical protein
MIPPTKCAKCGGELAEGFVPAEGEVSGGVTTWIAGPPQFGFMGSVKTDGRAAHKVRVFRCSKCGLLESYAPGSL